MTPEIIEPFVRRTAKNPKGELTEIDFEKVVEITFCNKGIKDLRPIRKFTSANNITLSDNAISDLKPLANLKYLEGLQLQSNQITDLKP